jgi:GDP-L-fucose synthase
MKTVFVAGHRGMVGAAIVRNLEKRGGVFIITRARNELDLTSQQAVSKFFAE